ncbi:glyoxalase [Gordoniibacillus kamchatkensis]|uniref:Glyoxalase n=1 Tax=Gordoniibacillus kamchatkensis TaxID=1590651 RepID=A0ABR5AJK7_9BACL|nr:VOC family protein [Paenibacillus sp. VKM B-2647]KIL41199.1 glyoxalase [Paenibacillus sp. VKM B-2647]
MGAKKIEHVGLMVNNLETSIAFYEQIAGFKLRAIEPHTNGVIRLAFLSHPEAPDTELELIEGYNSGLPAEGKVHHVAFATGDIEREWERLKGLNVPFIDAEITTLPSGARYFFFYGPVGEWLEFFEPPAV